MRITTLETEHNEFKLKVDRVKRQVVHAGAGVAAVLVSGAIALHPLEALTLVANYWSYALVAFLGVATRFL